MKKIKKTAKLKLETETIRVLNDDLLSGAVGAFPTGGCVTTTCQPTVGVTCNSVNPCTLGPTVTLCVTYVQAGCPSVRC